MRTVSKAIVAAALCVAAVQLAAAGRQRGGPAAPQAAGGPLDVLHVQGKVYLIGGAGANITAQVGDDGVVLVDTPPPALVAGLRSELAKLSRLPLRRIINTSIDPDRVGANAELNRPPYGRGAGPGGHAFGIAAHETVLNRMAAATSPPVPGEMWPTMTYYLPTMDFMLNGESIVLEHEPAAHSDGDTLVFFRGSNVISAGALYTPDRYPMINVALGGTVQGMIAALNRILALTVPSAFQEGGTYVIPGYGRVGDEADVVEYRDMLVIVRDRIQDLVAKGRTLDQVKASKPTRDYDNEYGAATGPWTTEMFVEAVYRSLTEKRQVKP